MGYPRLEEMAFPTDLWLRHHDFKSGLEAEPTTLTKPKRPGFLY